VKAIGAAWRASRERGGGAAWREIAWHRAGISGIEGRRGRKSRRLIGSKRAAPRHNHARKISSTRGGEMAGVK